jgi:hypothetical protein
MLDGGGDPYLRGRCRREEAVRWREYPTLFDKTEKDGPPDSIWTIQVRRCEYATFSMRPKRMGHPVRLRDSGWAIQFRRCEEPTVFDKAEKRWATRRVVAAVYEELCALTLPFGYAMLRG